MKYILLPLFISCLVSCSKQSTGLDSIPSYIGSYNDARGDTAIVTENGFYTKIYWGRKGGLVPYTFDSVMVNTDLTFTDNENVFIPGYPAYKSVGTGKFGTNTIEFSFTVHGATINFKGVR